MNEDVIFPTASVIKAPLLVALFEEVEAGRIDLDERVTVGRRDRVPGSGVLADLAPGIAPTLRDLAILMTVVSDNTATDLLLRRVGTARVESSMRALGLASIACPHTIREMLALPWRVDPAAPDAYEQVERAWREHPEGSPAPIAAEDGDRATPRDLCRLFELIERREVALAGEVLAILERQKSTTRLPALLPPGTRVAHKTGTIRGTRNDCGIVYAPGGPLAIALLSKDVRNDLTVDLELAHIARAVYLELEGTARS